MKPDIDIGAPQKVTPADVVATAILVTALSLAVFYPETFISESFMIGAHAVIPLNYFAPILALTAAVYVFIRRELLDFGLADAALLLFFGYLIARNIIAGIETAAVIKYAAYGVGVFYLTVVIMKQEQLRRIFLWTLVTIIVVIVGYGILEYSLQENILLQESIEKIVPEPERGLHRAGSTLAHPVVFGAMLVQLFPFCILFGFQGRERWRRITGLSLAVIMIAALLLTFSKGSWMVALLYIFVSVVVIIRIRMMGSLKLIAILAASAIGALVVFWRQVYSELRWRGEASVNFRFRSWKGALEAFLEKPITGFGHKQGSSKLMSMEVGQQYYLFVDRVIAVDNSYLSLLLEQGIIGFLLWTSFLAMIVRDGIKGCKQNHGDLYWILAAMASVIGLSINAVTFEAWLVWPTYIMFFVGAGMVHSLSRRSQQS